MGVFYNMKVIDSCSEYLSQMSYQYQGFGF